MDTIMKRISLAKRSVSAFSALALAATMVPLAGAMPGAEVEQAYAAATPGKQMNITAPMSIEFGSSDSRISADASNATTTFKLQNKGEIGMAVSELNYLAPNKWAEANNFILKAKDEGQPLGLTKEADPTLFTMWEGNGANPGDATKTMKFDFATVGDKSIKWGSGVPNTIDTMIDVQPSNEQTCTLYMDLASSNAKLNTNAAVSNSYTSLGSVKFTFSECSTVGDLTGLNTEQLKTQDFYLKDTRSDATITKDQVFSLDQVSRASASISKYQYTVVESVGGTTEETPGGTTEETPGGTTEETPDEPTGETVSTVVSSSPYYYWYKDLLDKDIEQHSNDTLVNQHNPIEAYECRTYWGSHSKNMAKTQYQPTDRDNATYDVRIIGILHDDKAKAAVGAQSANDADIKDNSKAGLTFQFVYVMDESDITPWNYITGGSDARYRSWGYRINYSDSQAYSNRTEEWSTNDGTYDTNYSCWAESELRERMNQTYSVAQNGLAKTYREKYSTNYDARTPERNASLANKEKTIYDLAPTALTDKMVPVSKQTGKFTAGGVTGDAEASVNTPQDGELRFTSDKMFIASYTELSGNYSGRGSGDNVAKLSGNDGLQYEYYKGINATDSATSPNRLTKLYQWMVDNEVGTITDALSGSVEQAAHWFTRSIRPGAYNQMLDVLPEGRFGENYPGNALGICPCFCL
ncbi:hypothetical protein [Adlercreutzia sp. ZJ154]|uniref:hypothetical protein n=1 Tax=Adlercreutzia sp. ZJ154 TaxID=2709790 RepID=UPI001980EF90|nr:hypothetical protein [Adlercreutzia sp. ZJ154]